jgi:hypothetical protein
MLRQLQIFLVPLNVTKILKVKIMSFKTRSDAYTALLYRYNSLFYVLRNADYIFYNKYVFYL